MPSQTIKLLNERRNHSEFRKVDGYSGIRYIFQWRDEHRAYCYTTDEQKKVDDLFGNQGRNSGLAFAPVLEQPKVEEVKPLSADVALALMQRELELPDDKADTEALALALLAAYDRGHAIGVKETCAKFERGYRPDTAVIAAAEPKTESMPPVLETAVGPVATAAEPIATVAEIAPTVSEPIATVQEPMPTTEDPALAVCPEHLRPKAKGRNSKAAKANAPAA